MVCTGIDEDRSGGISPPFLSSTGAFVLAPQHVRLWGPDDPALGSLKVDISPRYPENRTSADGLVPASLSETTALFSNASERPMCIRLLLKLRSHSVMLHSSMP